MNDEHLEAELERLDAQCQRMAYEYCELEKAHSKLKSNYADLRFVCKELGIYEKEKRLLKAEVARLQSASFVTAVPCEQYERVVKAGDAMAHSIDEVISGKFEAHQAAGDAYMLLYIRKWNAAKEGKGQP